MSTRKKSGRTVEEQKQVLSEYIPEPAVDAVFAWITEHKVHFTITRNRISKLGDYRHPHRGKGHRITVNHNLNKFAFLITVLHEIAHLLTFELHKNKVSPHGKEWKNQFKQVLRPFLLNHVFPEDVLDALNRYIINPEASHCSDVNLLRTLRKYDQKATDVNGLARIHVEDLPIDTIFVLENGMTLRKGELLRKRFKCIDIKTQKTYLVNPLPEVSIAQKSPDKKGQFQMF